MLMRKNVNNDDSPIDNMLGSIKVGVYLQFYTEIIIIAAAKTSHVQHAFEKRIEKSQASQKE